MSDKYILGIDPGLKNFGVVVTDLDMNLKLFENISTEKGRCRLISEDDFVRAQKVNRRLEEIFSTYNIVLVCAEAMSSPRNSKAVKCMAYTWGCIVSITERYMIPVVQESPQGIKKFMTGKANSTKPAMLAAIKKMGYKLPKTNKSVLEHPVDALCAIIACQHQQIFRAVKQ